MRCSPRHRVGGDQWRRIQWNAAPRAPRGQAADGIHRPAATSVQLHRRSSRLTRRREFAGRLRPPQEARPRQTRSRTRRRAPDPRRDGRPGNPRRRESRPARHRPTRSGRRSPLVQESRTAACRSLRMPATLPLVRATVCRPGYHDRRRRPIDSCRVCTSHEGHLWARTTPRLLSPATHSSVAPRYVRLGGSLRSPRATCERHAGSTSPARAVPARAPRPSPDDSRPTDDLAELVAHRLPRRSYTTSAAGPVSVSPFHRQAPAVLTMGQQ